MLRMATVFELQGVSITALKGRSWPSSRVTRILTGVGRAVPKLGIGVERATLGAEHHLHLLHRRGGMTKCGVSHLHQDRRVHPVPAVGTRPCMPAMSTGARLGAMPVPICITGATVRVGRRASLRRHQERLRRGEEREHGASDCFASYSSVDDFGGLSAEGAVQGSPDLSTSW